MPTSNQSDQSDCLMAQLLPCLGATCDMRASRTSDVTSGHNWNYYCPSHEVVDVSDKLPCFSADKHVGAI